jgi:hypothetical protein
MIITPEPGALAYVIPSGERAEVTPTAGSYYFRQLPELTFASKEEALSAAENLEGPYFTLMQKNGNEPVWTSKRVDTQTRIKLFQRRSSTLKYPVDALLEDFVPEDPSALVIFRNSKLRAGRKIFGANEGTFHVSVDGMTLAVRETLSAAEGLAKQLTQYPEVLVTDGPPSAGDDLEWS